MIDLDIGENGLWTVTLNRPDKANALTAAMLEQLCDIAERARQARGLIITGAGRVFSAGADLDAARAGLATSPLWEQLSGAIADLPCLTVAALNGTLAGGANGMALACDLRIAVPTAKFFYPVMKLGYRPQPSDARRMAALIGPARTKMILAAGQKITADEAHIFGLIDRIVASDALMTMAHELMADSLAAEVEMARAILEDCGPA
ncbi:enoyl-CoA hydratase/isomerase family protein [Phaeobacter gallaeciensis]|uniref:Enoyl-CoA hydratase/isomerase family protein n=1 Tax=Phaeobacter gallaeciensis TaxID=60890 RepID=A0AAD0EEE1_9RHOB|nr:enoyl-CoA hydratase/isomerase family protein [Phaeobacter gallaeciensis]AHD11123.1 Enoyl-CoA hydratase/carnithine racemase [Phaeobacter gallaeciensis DSM 26640]ATE94386.1 putative enoyl-CoA hydratase/isomerase family protein [Phaeobacter gallaeciensis]ATE98659.1 putative enoyl-CoA hydratase/isomerase family protein [Phaeobacter gallaeciensis]ATF03050.1 putative enoyl-CoA hydratase/isomerase family protein [Phaeobacter gallaeciensis]ATF07430.1 putative enoyl-CoA hydratase/isomerase family pr